MIIVLGAARDQAGLGSGQAWGSGLVERAATLTQRGAQQGLGGIGGRARGDRAGMGAVELTQLDAVEGNPGIIRRHPYLVHGLVPVFVIQVPRTIAAMHAHHPARHATYHKASGPTARGCA